MRIFVLILAAIAGTLLAFPVAWVAGDIYVWSNPLIPFFQNKHHTWVTYYRMWPIFGTIGGLSAFILASRLLTG